MRRLTILLAILMLLITGCKEGKPRLSDGPVTVDLTTNYPKKEMILQDIFDVEYIPLETNDDFVTQGYLRAIGKDIIVVRNYLGDGDIYFFNRKDGKGLKKINYMGNGSGEYQNITDILLDEDTGQMILSDGFGNKMLWYDLEGNFIRSFGIKEDATYMGVYNFDEDNLFCFDTPLTPQDVEDKKQSFSLISKQDGHITKDIDFVFDKKKSMILRFYDSSGTARGAAFMEAYTAIIPYQDHFILTELSCDTIYRYTLDHQMTPFMVRTPSIQTMEEPEVYLFPTVLTDSYYFMLKVEKVWDFELNKGFPIINLMYDKEEKTLYECHMYNRDYLTKKPIDMRFKFGYKDIAFWQMLDAPELMEAYEEGKLKGRLKEIAAKMDEESNPVLLIAKHKR